MHEDALTDPDTLADDPADPPETTSPIAPPTAEQPASGPLTAAPDTTPPTAPDAPETAPPASEDPPATDPAPLAPVPLDALRALVLRAYPEALPELVSGDTLEALLASAERAVALRARLLAEAQRAVPPVSAGAPRRLADAEAGRLSPLEKIARALERERS